MATEVEPRLMRMEEAARLLSIGRTRAYQMAATGALPGVVRLGRSVRVSRPRLLEWIDAQVDGASDELAVANR